MTMIGKKWLSLWLALALPVAGAQAQQENSETQQGAGAGADNGPNGAEQAVGNNVQTVPPEGEEVPEGEEAAAPGEAGGGEVLVVPTDVAEPDAEEIDLAVPGPSQETGVGVPGDETISVDFPDVEIRTIISNVADLYDLNVVIPDTLVGSTTVKLRNVTWRQILDVTLEPIGYTYVEDRNIIKIKSVDELAQEPTTTRVFLINFAVANELQGSISPLVDAAAGGRVQVDRRTNALVITERPSRMNQIQEVIDRLDRPTAQVQIESKFVETTVEDFKELGIDWSSLVVNPIGGGADAFFGDGVGGPGAGTANGQDFDGSGSSFNIFSGVGFDTVLNALEENTDSRVITNPTVVALNNTKAEINIGEEFPIPEFTFNDETGTFQVSGFEFRDIGINLEVTPQVNSAGFINLMIVPEISSSDERINFSSGNGAVTEIPIIDTRKVETSVMIKDGYTLAIGGLIEDSTNNEVTKVRFLGDLPVIGRLFRQESFGASDNPNERRNLIVFITAKTLNPSGASYEETVDPRQLFEMGLTERDVPGYEVPQEELEQYEMVERLRAGIDAETTREQLRNTLAAERQARLDEIRRAQERAAEETPGADRPLSRSYWNR